MANNDSFGSPQHESFDSQTNNGFDNQNNDNAANRKSSVLPDSKKKMMLVCLSFSIVIMLAVLAAVVFVMMEQKREAELRLNLQLQYEEQLAQTQQLEIELRQKNLEIEEAIEIQPQPKAIEKVAQNEAPTVNGRPRDVILPDDLLESSNDTASPKSQFETIIKKQINPKVQSCYTDLMQRSGKLTGKVLFSVVISTDGTVDEVSIEAPDSFDQESRECMTSVFKNATFSKADKPIAFRKSYVFN